MKRVASIQDISCLGKCSLTVALPIISAMGVECSARPLTAVLEVIREEENETITVQGESFTALFSAAERQTGEQDYLGALQRIVFSD